MPKIDEDIRNAILLTAEELGSQAKVASAAGITPGALNRYLKGKVLSINAATWNLLAPVIHHHLRKDQLKEVRMEINAKTFASHSQVHPEGDYTLFRMMSKALYDIGGDWLLMQILMAWHGMSDEQKQKAYKAVASISEEKTDGGGSK